MPNNFLKSGSLEHSNVLNMRYISGKYFDFKCEGCREEPGITSTAYEFSEPFLLILQRISLKGFKEEKTASSWG